MFHNLAFYSFFLSGNKAKTKPISKLGYKILKNNALYRFINTLLYLKNHLYRVFLYKKIDNSRFFYLIIF